jgi:hypothetical protein
MHEAPQHHLLIVLKPLSLRPIDYRFFIHAGE